MRIEGSVALVTGGGSGLGAATASHLVKLGARVAILDRDRIAAENVASATSSMAIELDVSDDVAASEALCTVDKALGPPAILINCAGIAPAAKIVGRGGEMPLAEFQRVIAVNLIGSFNMLRLTAAAMIEREPNEQGERGVIVNTASVAAFDGQIGQAAYAASKGGIASLTLPAAREFASKGIRVAAIAPGLFATPLLLNMPQPVQDSLAETVPFPSRFGRPSEFAALVQHICENAMINGEVIRLDGALRMAAR